MWRQIKKGMKSGVSRNCEAQSSFYVPFLMFFCMYVSVKIKSKKLRRIYAIILISKRIDVAKDSDIYDT